MDILNFNECINLIPGVISYQKNLALWEINKETYKTSHTSLAFTKLYSLIIVRQGYIKIKIDNKEAILNKNSFVQIINCKILQLTEVSNDAEAYQLISTMRYMQQSLKFKKKFPISYMIELHTNPRIEIDVTNTNTLIDYIQKIKDAILNANSLFQEEIIQCLLNIQFMEMGNLVVKQNDIIFSSERLNRKEQILLSFIMLIQDNAKSKHEIEFYAQEINITSQYLANIIKELTGYTTHHWICQALIEEAKFLLNDSNMSIQQIANDLHFSDQASFSKFFKKHTTLSPVSYRKSNKDI